MSQQGKRVPLLSDVPQSLSIHSFFVCFFLMVDRLLTA